MFALREYLMLVALRQNTGKGRSDSPAVFYQPHGVGEVLSSELAACTERKKRLADVEQQEDV